MMVAASLGEPLDAICWRILGRTAGVFEQALALNPGLSALGAIVPAGTLVTLPEITNAAPAMRETVKLWDLGAA